MPAGNFVGGALGGLTGTVVGRAIVQIVGDTTGVQTAFGKARATATAESTAMGSGVSRFALLAKSGFAAAEVAVVAFVAKGVQAAVRFQSEMNKLNSLVGLSREEVAKLSAAVLTLSQATAQSPQKLAEALYFVESAGFRGAAAMDILTQSAKGSTIGMGDTQMIARTLAGTLNAYASTGLTASHAMDILVAAVRTGHMPMQDLSNVIAMVSPTAAEMGVSFDQVAGALAAASRVSMPMTRAATGLRYMLSALLSPSRQASTLIDKVFGSVTNLHKAIAQDGLLLTLERLKKGLTPGEFAVAVGGVRSLVLALSLVGKNAAQVKDVMDQVRDSSGSFGRAWTSTTQRVQFQLQRLGAEFQAALVTTGTSLLPVLALILHGLQLLMPVIGFAASHIRELLIAFVAYKTIMWLPTFFSSLAAALGAMEMPALAGFFNTLAISMATMGTAQGALAVETEVTTAAMADQALIADTLAASLAATAAAEAAATGAGVAEGVAGAGAGAAAAAGAGIGMSGILMGATVAVFAGIAAWDIYRAGQRHAQAEIRATTAALLSGKAAVDAYNVAAAGGPLNAYQASQSPLGAGLLAARRNPAVSHGPGATGLGYVQAFGRKDASGANANVIAAQHALATATGAANAVIEKQVHTILADYVVYNTWGMAIERTGRATVMQRVELASTIETLHDYGIAMSQSQQENIRAAMAASDFAQAQAIANDILNKATAAMLNQHSTQSKLANQARQAQTVGAGFAMVTGQPFAEFKTAAQDAYAASISGAKGSEGAWIAFTTKTLDAFAKWKDGLVSSMNFVQGSLGDLANTKGLTSGDILKTFDKQLKSMRDYGKNWQTLVKDGAPKSFLNQLSAMGSQAAPIMNALVHGTAKTRARIFADWTAAGAKSRSLADLIGNTLVGSIQKLTDAINRLAGNYTLTISANTAAANAALDALASKERALGIQVSFSGAMSGGAEHGGRTNPSQPPSGGGPGGSRTRNPGGTVNFAYPSPGFSASGGYDYPGGGGDSLGRTFQKAMEDAVSRVLANQQPNTLEMDGYRVGYASRMRGLRMGELVGS